jgi:hypothetical protein
LFNFMIVYGFPLFQSRCLFVLKCWRVSMRISGRDFKRDAV